MVKKVTQTKKVEVEQVDEEEVQEQPKSNVKKLVKKETPAPTETKAKKEKAAPKEEDPNQVTLKQICEEHGLNATTARVKLRRKFGAEGKRYSWEKESAELEEVVTLLTTKAEKEEAEPKAKTAPKKKSKKAAEPEIVDEAEEEEGDEEGEEVEVE